jgi:Holliday junction resolvasome RuvABC endonuclease subunit
MTHVLGIDLGITKQSPTAACLIDIDTMHLVDTMTYVARGDAWEQRVQSVTRRIRGLLATVKPVHLVCFEMPVFQYNQQSTIRLSTLAGAILATADLYGIPVVGVSPAQAKQALSGFSTATKNDQIAAAATIFGVRMSSHVADACGVALAGEAAYRRRELQAA